MLYPFKIHTFMTMGFDEISKMIEFIGSEYLNEPMSLSYAIFKAKINREIAPSDKDKKVVR